MARAITNALAFLLLLPALGLDTAAQGAAAQAPRAASAATCAADFERAESKVRADYAGFREKVAGHEAELSAFTERVRAEAAAAANSAACTFPPRARAVSPPCPSTSSASRPTYASAGTTPTPSTPPAATSNPPPPRRRRGIQSRHPRIS